MTTPHPGRQDTANMFEEVVVGVGDDDTGRDAVALGKELVSPQGRLTPAPRAGGREEART